ncbi:MAG TPA: hypothetical protein PKL73_11250 [Polyangiaceae bacterium]|jgi:hypothetical protein|nr:MAG: hypothetical protein BWY17_03520 [Deltaproteobacteria bacterium ADurb.Bin207]HNS97517.1 hypothetical protein [Polyangiaceae bacterium]HNZ21930.1 hypothetical protein [Polyangiaceae bacterium]HOD23381.1 hypothetical protein [Polyangiaceae bacterium]HOE49323.1 hypothetical protein [Polyangiaceae bacterium]
MAELVAVIVSFPAVVPTVLLGVVLLYWVMVVVGVLDVDFMSGEGAADGVLEGVQGVDALVQGAPDAAVEGIVDGAAHGITEGVADGVVEGSVDGVKGLVEITHASATPMVTQGVETVNVLSFAHFRSVPVTVSASVVTVFSWLFCVLSVRILSPFLGQPSWVPGLGMLLASVVLALPPSALLLRPLANVFRVQHAKSFQDLVGHVCVVTTGTVNDKFGQARLEVTDLDLLVQVRTEQVRLQRGDRGLIVAWDARREVFIIEPYDKLLEG